MQKQREVVEAEKVALGEKYIFFQELEEEAGQVISCLREKKQDIEKARSNLTEELQSSDEKRRKFHILDILEDHRECFQEREPSNTKTLSDLELQAREKRKRKRKEKRLGHETFVLIKRRNLEEKFSPDCEDGWKTDDDSGIEEQFTIRRNTLVRDFDLVFRDAKEEMHSFDDVQARFEICREKYPKAYLEAFISESFRGLVGPYVELELLKWNPLTAPELSSMHWFRQLDKFTKESDEKIPDENDDDLRIVPALIEKYVIPMIMETVIHVWNLFSQEASEKFNQKLLLRVAGFVQMRTPPKMWKNSLKRILDRINEGISSHLRPQTAFPPNSVCYPKNHRIRRKR
eukprot:TRINITY_DN771_c0_g1_i3.p1 TRINITY_DN771_c0_g1~~TRINITY_DN771_c0_g1_i3.p1  ORF type:complete len:346 (+),score=86.12 TRINITY_DN771_c0_g1_i3:757-1794(+)